MNLVQYNEYLVSTVDTDGQGISGYSADWVCMHPCQSKCLWVNSSTPSATYMHQWIGLALVQIMTSCLFGAKPLPKPMLGSCQLDPKEQTSVKF